MKNVDAALKTHLAGHQQTMATCVLAVREDAETFRFTDHDMPITIAGWAGARAVLNGTYTPAAGLSTRSIATSDALNVDNTRGSGPLLEDDSITVADLVAGYWNDCKFYFFQVNWADLTMGPLVQRVGWIGEVTAGRDAFDAQFMGLMKRYTGSILELTSPLCRADLGDARCKVDLGPHTAAGTLTGVSADNSVLFDTSRTEDGPGGGVAVTNVSNANPGVVTMADDSLQLYDGQPVVISGVGGMTPVNGTTLARNPDGATFELGVDTSDTAAYPVYTSGGMVTPLGGTAGTFDFGYITFTSGNNNGRRFKIRSYVEGQITLYQPLPRLAQVDDTYSIVRGCDKSLATCRDVFDNVNNRRAEDYMSGTDRIMQLGKASA